MKSPVMLSLFLFWCFPKVLRRQLNTVRYVVKAITRNDPHTRGIVVLGLDAPADQLAASFALAAQHDLVKGFAVGRTIFAEAARQWLAGSMSDAEAVADMVAKYENLCRVWDAARAKKELAA